MKHYPGLAMIMAAAVRLGPAAHSAPATPVDPAHPSLSFLKFTVSNLPAMQTFYEKAFGMQQQKRLDGPANTEVILTTPGGADLALVFYKDKRAVALGNANGPIGFYLTDVDGAYKRAMAAGAVSRSAPGGGPGVRVAIVADPEGHDIELLHLD